MTSRPFGRGGVIPIYIDCSRVTIVQVSFSLPVSYRKLRLLCLIIMTAQAKVMM